MNKTALVYHEDYLKHRQPEGHPERPERLVETLNYFEKKGLLEKLTIVKPEVAKREDLLRVHSRELVDFMENLCSSGGGFLDSDTFVCRDTCYVARLSAGGVIKAAEVVMEGKFDNSFALVRPPGHHASRNKSMGFCYFNNVAVMIKYIQEKYDLKRILVLDWDAHAFNGTMDIFYDTRDVLKISIHQDPRTLYPGTGFISQIGSGIGEGYTVNVPVPAGTEDSDYVYIFDEIVIPLAFDYKPQFMVISAGQDSHRDDPLSGLCLTESGYEEMTNILLKTSEELCDGRLVVELEGGYNLESLKKSNYAIVSSLIGDRRDETIKGKVKDSIKELAGSLKKILGNYHTI